MTMMVPLGVVSPLEGVVLVLTSTGTKNLPCATIVLLRCKGATKLGNDDTLQSLYKDSIVVKSKLLCRLGGKLGNDNMCGLLCHHCDKLGRCLVSGSVVVV
uniref:Uncharacterized protein n=1 Tax=Oryza meridionalis TaxID=40149 RepID=A0A0E0C3V4_9ORYZ